MSPTELQGNQPDRMSDDAAASSDIEQETSPQPAPRHFPVVGIGASAGGLVALQHLLQEIPVDSGLAWVVITHLSPDHESHLTSLLQSYTAMPVQEVVDEMELVPNQIYVLPPNRNLAAIDSHLRLEPLEQQPQARAPVDHFFRTLADTHRDQAVGIVLSGSGSDGALGLARIKEMGGLPVVQSPAEAEFDSMPRSAIAVGQVDLVVPVAEIPGRIVDYLQRSQVLPAAPEIEQPKGVQDGLQQILMLVRMHTGHDFSRYRAGTILRRVQHRMQLLGVTSVDHYIGRLRTDLGEVQALGNDFLISVTNFFRDRNAFQLLEQEIIPQLFADKNRDDHVRVWVIGCATGEEAYSLGILLLEHAGQLHQPPQIQIFASDLSETALRRARDGIYPETIAQDVSAERLARFFSREQGGYRVRKELRELILFAPHNVLKDPPFSRVALISCRNVLIYLEREIQEHILEIFHYALQPKGVLFLGASEVIDRSRLFETINRRQSLYRRRDIGAHEQPLPTLSLAQTALPLRMIQSAGSLSLPAPAVGGRGSGQGATIGRILEQYGPPSLLVAEDHNIVYYSQGVNRFLDTPAGEPTHQVIQRVRKELAAEVTAGLFRAFENGGPSFSVPITLTLEGSQRQVLVGIWPTGNQEPGSTEPRLALVLFHEREVQPAGEPIQTQQVEDTILGLEGELAALQRRLQTTMEEYETSKEEMQAANEELQSMNEELRATAEELETSKEEMQSINEELMTVNQENKHRVEEMTQLTSDLQNLLIATDIATLFLDRQLHITRFTPRAGELFNVLPTDRGRPLAHLTHKLGYAHLLDDAAQVLRTLIPVQREIKSDSGQWYLTRLMPYRSLDDRIEGVVITLVEITSQKENELALRHVQERYQQVSDSGLIAIAFVNADGVVLEANDAFAGLMGYTQAEIHAGQVHWEQLTPPEWTARAQQVSAQLSSGERIAPYHREYLRKDGGRFWGLSGGAKVANRDEYVAFVVERDGHEPEGGTQHP